MEYNVTRKFLREAKLLEESCDSVVAQDVWDGVLEPQRVRYAARHAYYNNSFSEANDVFWGGKESHPASAFALPAFFSRLWINRRERKHFKWGKTFNRERQNRREI